MFIDSIKLFDSPPHLCLSAEPGSGALVFLLGAFLLEILGGSGINGWGGWVVQVYYHHLGAER